MGRDRTFSKHTVRIGNGASASAAIPLGVETIAAIGLPAAWDAAVLAFEISPDGGTTWLPVIDDGGTEVSVAAATIAGALGRAIVPNTILSKLNSLAGVVRLQSGPVGGRVNQTANRDLIVWAKTL